MQFKCEETTRIPGRSVRCGRCDMCCADKAYILVGQIKAELRNHEHSAFLTLTYAPEFKHYVPNIYREGEFVENLEKRDLDLFLKRLRKAIEPLKIKFVAVGEFGDQTYHAHFHVLVFNFPGCSAGSPPGCECVSCSTVRKAWGLGFILCAPVTPERSAYVADHHTKKRDPRKLAHIANHGLNPEFLTRSNRGGGIGHTIIGKIVSDIEASGTIETQIDFPMVFGLNDGSIYKLSQYMRRKGRRLMGRPDTLPEAVSVELEKLLAADEAEADFLAESDPRFSGPRGRLKALQFIHRRDSAGVINKFKGRQKLYKKRPRNLSPTEAMRSAVAKESAERKRKGQS